jgi:hypothetical protein
MSWIGVDLDGTLAYYDTWKGPEHIGRPIEPMVRRVKYWLAEGKEVRIFTARAYSDGTPERDRIAMIAVMAIENWCAEHIGRVLPVTCVKDYAMKEVWDDRAIQVVENMGEPIDPITAMNRATA